MRLKSYFSLLHVLEPLRDQFWGLILLFGASANYINLQQHIISAGFIKLSCLFQTKTKMAT